MNRTQTSSVQKESSPIWKSLFGVPPHKLHTLLPGLIFTCLLAWFSIWVSDFAGTELLGFEKSPISAVMTAILLGIVISNLVKLPPWLTPGFTFTVKKLLRLGIIFLGIRLSIIEMFKLGALGVPIVVGCIAGALFFTIVLSRRLHLPEKLGTLIAVGTSICGVSAIVATGPAIEAREEEVAYAVSVITVFGIVATLVYPYLAHIIFGGDAVRAGLFLGTAVHDTSQVTGSALLYSEVFRSPETLNVAVVTKLVRNIFMALVIPFMAYYYTKGYNTASKTKDKKKFNIAKYFPLFIIGFLLLGILRSAGDMTLQRSGAAFGILQPEQWQAGYGFLKTWAVNFLVIALAGVGLSTRFRQLKELGIKPFLAGLVAAVVVGLISFTLITLLGKFITVI